MHDIDTAHIVDHLINSLKTRKSFEFLPNLNLYGYWVCCFHTFMPIFIKWFCTRCVSQTEYTHTVSTKICLFHADYFLETQCFRCRQSFHLGSSSQTKKPWAKRNGTQIYVKDRKATKKEEQ